MRPKIIVDVLSVDLVEEPYRNHKRLLLFWQGCEAQEFSQRTTSNYMVFSFNSQLLKFTVMTEEVSLQ